LSISTRYRHGIVDIDDINTYLVRTWEVCRYRHDIVTVSTISTLCVPLEMYSKLIVDIDMIASQHCRYRRYRHINTHRSVQQVSCLYRHDIVKTLSISTPHVHVKVYGKSIVDIDTILSQHCRYRRYRNRTRSWTCIKKNNKIDFSGPLAYHQRKIF
jgi:hypothetical protein